MKNIYQEVVKIMSRLEKYYYTFEVRTWDDFCNVNYSYRNGYTNEYMREKCQGREFYGDYKVDFTTKTAYITVNSNNKQFMNQVIYYNDQKVHFRQEGRGWDILKLKKEDYNALFKQDGNLSLFDFNSFETNGMDTQSEGKKIVLNNIYLPKFDFRKKVYDLNAYKVEVQVDVLTNMIDIVIFDGGNRLNCSNYIRYKYKLVGVNELVNIKEPF